MPEKVIGGGFLVPGAAEVKVPSWKEFDEAKSFVWQETQKIWRAVDQLTEHPNQEASSEYDKEIRKVFADIRELERNVWREEGGRTPLWNFVGGLRERLDALESRLGTLPDALSETVREAVRAELEPLLKPAAENIGAILEDNRKLREELAALRAEVNTLKTTSNH